MMNPLASSATVVLTEAQFFRLKSVLQAGELLGLRYQQAQAALRAEMDREFAAAGLDLGTTYTLDAATLTAVPVPPRK